MKAATDKLKEEIAAVTAMLKRRRCDFDPLAPDLDGRPVDLETLFKDLVEELFDNVCLCGVVAVEDRPNRIPGYADDPNIELREKCRDLVALYARQAQVNESIGKTLEKIVAIEDDIPLRDRDVPGFMHYLPATMGIKTPGV